jgi:hypothetical protein
LRGPGRGTRPSTDLFKDGVTNAVVTSVVGSRGGIAGVYQRHDWAAEKRAALEWAAHLLAVAERRTPADNVVKLTRAG